MTTIGVIKRDTRSVGDGSCILGVWTMVHVSNTWVLWALVLVLLWRFGGKYVIIEYLDP